MSFRSVAARIAECDRRIEESLAARAAVIEDLLADLAWMDIPVRRVSLHGSSVPDGSAVHVLELVEEMTGRRETYLHRVDQCPGHWCRTVGATLRTPRRRPGFGTSFTYLGVHTLLAVDSEGNGYAINPANIERHTRG